MDEAMLTGGANPAAKTTGDTVSAGPPCRTAPCCSDAAAVGSKTTLARIIKLVRQAQAVNRKSASWRTKSQPSFVPVVVVIALIAGAVWYFFGPAPQITYALVIITTVLIIACPCALGLATPMSIISGSDAPLSLVCWYGMRMLYSRQALSTPLFSTKPGPDRRHAAGNGNPIPLMVSVTMMSCVSRRRWKAVLIIRWPALSLNVRKR